MKALLQQALEALDELSKLGNWQRDSIGFAISQRGREALRTAIAQAEQEQPWGDWKPEEVERMHALGWTTQQCEICGASAHVSKPSAQAAKPLSEPDQFWNDDDRERNYSSISEFLNEEICNGTPVEVGSTFTLLRAVSLPKITIRVTSVDEEQCEADWEIVEAAHNIKEQQP